MKHALIPPRLVRAALLVVSVWARGAAPPPAAASGSEEKPDEPSQQLMEEVGGQAKGTIVWSSSRLGNHDLFVMNTDGSNVHPITHGEPWTGSRASRPTAAASCSPAARRAGSSSGTPTPTASGTSTRSPRTERTRPRVVDNASWGTWISNDEIVYVRATAIVRRKLGDGEETVVVDSTKVPELDGALLQQPEMSKDGRYLAITLRGSKRETGIWNIRKKTWTRTGEGCQINWSPAGGEVYWVHPTGNGGSRVLHMPIKDGKAAKSDDDIDALTLIDIPGRRSHEYFPQLSADGHWLVWAATQRGHDHDIADYEIYLWQVGTPPEKAARLTWHSGNNRWPDIFVPGGAS